MNGRGLRASCASPDGREPQRGQGRRPCASIPAVASGGTVMVNFMLDLHKVRGKGTGRRATREGGERVIKEGSM